MASKSARDGRISRWGICQKCPHISILKSRIGNSSPNKKKTDEINDNKRGEHERFPEISKKVRAKKKNQRGCNFKVILEIDKSKSKKNTYSKVIEKSLRRDKHNGSPHQKKDIKEGL